MLYAFSLTTKLEELLGSLKTPDRCHLVQDNNIDHCLKLLIDSQPSYILGMGGPRCSKTI